MHDIIDLERYPLNEPLSTEWLALVENCRERLSTDGLFNLPGFIHDTAISTALESLKPRLSEDAYNHVRRHNIYFKKTVAGLSPSHPALTEHETSNRTLCADQLKDNLILQLYEWKPFSEFLSAVMKIDELFTMEDPLARVNVMGYSENCALNWHFDRSEFTTTLLLQAPRGGGEFEYAKDLRSEHNPNYDAVSDLLRGQRTPTRMPLNPGTLNVFRGKNTAHRVTPVQGDKDRIIAVFSYFNKPGVLFSEEERLGFYGRAS